MKRLSPYSPSSSPGLSRRSTPLERYGKEGVDARHKAGHDDVSVADTLSNPVERGQMVTCWQDGRRVLMHSSEVARMMKKEGPPSEPSSTHMNPSPSSCAGLTRASMKRCDESKPCMDYRVSHRQTAREETRGPMRPGNDEKGIASQPMRPGNDEKGEARDRQAVASSDLTPPPFMPRPRRIAQNESWQFLAREMSRRAGHPPHCHKRACRRAKRCAGGRGACYLREFETVDILMQRLLHNVPRGNREGRAEGAGSVA